MCLAYNWNAKSQDRWRQLCFASSLRVRPSRETLVKHFVLPDCPIQCTLFVSTLYISSLPTNVEECFWEKTLTTNLEELEIVILTHLYIFTCEFSSTYTSQFPYHWEVDSPNTYHTLFRMSSEDLVLLGSIGKSQALVDCNRAYCEIWRARQDMISRSLVGVGAWRA